MWLDQHLNMEHHINKTVSLCYQSLKNVGRIRKVLSFENTEILVCAVISSRIDYCNSLINIERKNIFKLQKVQNSAARIVKLKNRRHSATSLLNELHWLPTQWRIVFRYLLLVFKCLLNEVHWLPTQWRIVFRYLLLVFKCLLNEVPSKWSSLVANSIKNCL